MTEPLYLRRIRNKKSSKKGSDVFLCLKKPVSLEKDFKKERRNIFFWNQAYEALCKIENPSRKQIRGKRKLERKLFGKARTPVFSDRIESKRKRIPKKYSVYIKSSHWEKRKNQLFQKFGRTCVICGSCERISVHHLRYDNSEFGIEKDKDLVIICWKHHEQFHQLYGVKKNSHKDFVSFKKTF